MWILSGGTLSEHWMRDTAPKLKDLNCTMDELKKATDGYFALSYDIINTRDTKTVSGKVIIIHVHDFKIVAIFSSPEPKPHKVSL